ncbi:MAG: hypothetical protein H5T86_10205, partial [Armatimonadetes bacterium]|nr:hypothetical protein [Armatimonadota bacterium]
VGNVCDNAAMLFLHSHYFVWADHFYPGPGGFEIRTVHDPWGAGVNALVVAASDPAGVTAAIPSLKSLLARAQRTEQSFTVPRFLETHLTGEAAQRLASRLSTEPDDKYIEGQKRAAEQRLKSGAHTGLFRQIADVGESYMRSQKSGFAQLFVWLVKRAYEHYQTKPSTYGGPWGMDSDFTVYRVLPAWDVVEEDPSLTDEQRWETTRILYQWVSEVAVGKAASVVGSGVPRFNHQTFPALGLLFAGEYFRKYYGIFEAERWLKIADECFRFQATCFKSHEDCNGYQWLVWEHLCRYALARPDFAFFVPRPITEATGTEPMGVDIGGRAVKGGLWASCSNAQRVADYAILSTDSFGYSATYGDTGNFQGWWSELPVLQMINFVLRDPTYQWAIDQKMRRSGRLIQPGYYVKLEPAIPSRLAGTHVFPLDERWWAAFGGDKNAPLRRALDKAVIRGGFEEDADYAILDGLNPGGHRHFDVNALSRVCLAGRIWVADASYYNQAAKYHSTAFVLRDGLGTPHPGFAQVGHAADLPDCGATETVLKGYNGCDWHRWLVWRRGLGLLVADRFVAQQDGDYSIRIYWQLLGEPRLENGRLVLEQVGREAALAFTADASVTLADDREGGENWTGYPFIRDPVVRVLRLTYDVRLRKGEEFIAWSLLTAAEGAVGDVRLVRDGQRAVIITGTGRWSEEVGPLAAGLESPPVAGPEALRQQSGAAWLVWPGGAMLVAAGDRSAQVDFGNGKATVARPATDQPDQRATLGTEVDQKLKAEPGTIRRDLARRAAATPKTVATPAEAVPERKPAWTLWPRPDDYVLTGNRGTLAACSCLRLVTCEPQPLEQNIFGGTANSLANLFDGKVERTENCTMWAVDQPVTIRLELDAEYELTELTIQAWFATSSSKNVKFQLGEVLVEASSDGFKNDVRTAGRLVDQEQHENWGGAAHVPERYSVALNATRASAVRVHLKPRPGTAVYLAELYLRGRGGPLAAPAGLLQRALAMERFTCLAPLRVGDRTDLVAGRSDGQVWRIGADGQMVWKKEVGREVLSIGVVKFDGRIPTIVCGCRDGLVVAFAPDGSELWRTELEYYKQPPHVRVVLAADFSGQGQETAVVGADSWRYYALDAAGKVVWLYESVH